MRDSSGNYTDDEIETDDSLFNVYYIKIIMMALLPFLIFIGCYGIWYLIGLCQRSLSKTKSRAIASLVIVLFLVHPDIVQYMFSFGVGIPGIIIWGLGIPFFAALLLSQVKNKLNLPETKEKFGFLYRGYKKQFYYWETIIMYRKIILIFIQVFLQIYGVIS
eukprot:CAMPEP_0202978386 /NCGR_PEP_ID=MMETSP1396-20130829/84826_1 /ASSEMBLY_ACC=CAM_ASM_000872 /TAXON_ID= /ORGANISM="Pseudokeronopsis sp., Strain Brazil" /LENGTH=161 /DNA_ID=CAMNT_0049717339 /DNA_START=282 /DNA_END=767 /DNA_ORIENTATION=-